MTRSLGTEGFDVCIVMAGGFSSRLGFYPKQRLYVCGCELLEYVLAMVEIVCKRVILVLSPWTLRVLHKYCARCDVDCILASGSGYVDDLRVALSMVVSRPVLVAPSDLLTDYTVALRIEPSACIYTFTLNGRPTGFSLFNCDSGDWVNVELPWGVEVDEWRDYTRLVEILCDVESPRGQRSQARL